MDDVGASEGGSPTVEGKLREADLLKALNLAIPRHDTSIPLTQNGLGYNNLIYIALLELRAQVSELLPGTSLKKITKGKIKEYAQKFTLRELLDTVKMVDDTRDAKTIHKAKGAEFETVLLYLPNEENLDRIIMPEAIQQEDVGESEEQRIAYVGISRARDNLYISVPMLSRDRKKAFEDKKLPIQIVDLEGSGANSRSV